MCDCKEVEKMSSTRLERANRPMTVADIFSRQRDKLLQQREGTLESLQYLDRLGEDAEPVVEELVRLDKEIEKVSEIFGVA